MSDGQTHYRYYVMNMPAAVAVSIFSAIFVDPFFGAGIAIGYLSGRWIDPDLDQPGLTKSEGRLFNELGILGALVASYWLPYGYIFRRHHRSIWTHFPGLSTFIRLLWMAPIPVLLGYWVGIPADSRLFWVVFGVWAGLTQADTVHYTLDILSGEIRRRKWKR